MGKKGSLGWRSGRKGSGYQHKSGTRISDIMNHDTLVVTPRKADGSPRVDKSGKKVEYTMTVIGKTADGKFKVRLAPGSKGFYAETIPGLKAMRKSDPEGYKLTLRKLPYTTKLSVAELGVLATRGDVARRRPGSGKEWQVTPDAAPSKAVNAMPHRRKQTVP